MCLTLCHPTNCSLLGFSLHGILQARLLEWVAIPFSRGSFRPRCPASQADSLPSLAGLMLKLELQYFGHLMQLIGKDPDSRKDWRQGEKGVTEDEMVGWYYWLNGHEFEQTPGDGGQGSLACYSPWGHKESDMTERLNNNKNVLRVCCCYFYVDRYSIDPVAFFERQISLVELTLYPCQKLVDHEVGFKFLLHSIDLYIHIFL